MADSLLRDDVPHQLSIHGILEELHHIMTRLREEVSTRMPKPEQTRLLHLRPRGDMPGLLYDVPVE